MLFLAGGCGLIQAQTNLPTAKPEAAQPAEVDSATAYFDMVTQRVIYSGNVRVTDPKIKLTCEWLLLDVPKEGDHINYISAETNVVVDFTRGDEKYHVTSARAVYNYNVVNQVTNETVTFTGNPIVDTKDGKIWSEPLVWDRTAQRFNFTHPKVILPHGLGGDGTNASPFKL
jgi:lipopolysaccharide export system protein LptA